MNVAWMPVYNSHEKGNIMKKEEQIFYLFILLLIFNYYFLAIFPPDQPYITMSFHSFVFVGFSSMRRFHEHTKQMLQDDGFFVSFLICYFLQSWSRLFFCLTKSCLQNILSNLTKPYLMISLLKFCFLLLERFIFQIEVSSISFQCLERGHYEVIHCLK